MARASESEVDLTSHTIRDIPDEFWDEWSEEIPRRYSRLGDALLELAAADLQCRQEHGFNAVDLLINEGYIERECVDKLLEPPDEESESEESGAGDTSNSEPE